MPRVREIEDAGDDPILKDIFAKETEIFGDVLNTTKVMAHTPPILKAAKQLAPPSRSPDCSPPPSSPS